MSVLSTIGKIGAFVTSSFHGEDFDTIRNYYRNVTPKPLKKFNLPVGAVLSSVCQGVGDTVMLTDLPKASQGVYQSFSPAEHFRWLTRGNPHVQEVVDKSILVNAPDLVRQYDCGNGHYIQRIRRAFGLDVDDKPKGSIFWTGKRDKSRVIMHFDAGVHALWQRQNIHPQARQIIPKTKLEIEKFIASRKDLEFVEIGKIPLRPKGSKYIQCENLGKMIDEIGKSSWFIGIMSGPMHVATALNLKCVVIVNFPRAETMIYPTLVVTDAVENEWCYGQNVHLHMDNEGPLVKLATSDNLNRAFNNELYPYGSDKFLSLIHEKL